MSLLMPVYATPRTNVIGYGDILNKILLLTRFRLSIYESSNCMSLSDSAELPTAHGMYSRETVGESDHPALPPRLDGSDHLSVDPHNCTQLCQSIRHVSADGMFRCAQFTKITHAEVWNYEHS